MTSAVGRKGGGVVVPPAGFGISALAFSLTVTVDAPKITATLFFLVENFSVGLAAPQLPSPAGIRAGLRNRDATGFLRDSMNERMTDWMNE